MYGEPQNNIVNTSLPHGGCSTTVADEERGRLWSLAAHYADGLPALPSSIFQLNRVLSQRTTDLNAIVRVLSHDVGLAAQVVKLANADVSLDHEFTCRLDECVVLLGLSRLRSLVLTTPLTPSDYESATLLQALCQHSYLTSRFGQRIAEACGHPEPYKANIACLLHDIGELPVHLGRNHLQDDSPFCVDHCIVGSWLARLWKLPPFLIDAIEHHHDPENARYDPCFTAVVSAADEVSRIFGVGLQIEPGAHLACDSMSVLDRYFSSLSKSRRQELASVLLSEFSEWAKIPVNIDFGEGREGSCELWQSAL